ncbi:MAG TPA: hypothetical protein EYP14_17705 [Planctomycetaceae bacterium]|nr:hypothetical protein [Planctomycetaceae bacterium]
MHAMTRTLALTTVLFALGFRSGPALRAAEPSEKAKPEREIVVAFEYPRLEVDPSTTIRLDLIIKNNGQKDETILLDVTSSPEGCVTKIEEYGDVIGGVFVASGEKKTLTVEAKLKKSKQEEGEEKDEKFAPGQYKFAVKGTTEDGKLTDTAEATVTVGKSEEEEEEEEDPVEITCSYPNLRGSNDSDFRFSVDIHNNTDNEDMASLRAEAPRGWEVAFKPSYEDKYIGSLKIDSNLSRSVDVEVKPPPGAEVGKYTIKVFAKLSKEDFEASRELTVELTGTYRIRCRTLNDVLSLTARGGQEATISMYVLNRGTAPQTNVTFDSFKPENWKVEFEPETIDLIKPGDMEQVEIKITPNADAIVGDYSVAINVNGEKAEDDLELRVTVKASTTWAWVGVGIIVGVIVLLSVMFRVLGRR